MESGARIVVSPDRITPAVELAVANFLNGYNCAESVLLAMSTALGLESEVVPAIATGFGAGFGRQGAVCGAISGAVIGIGLARGRSEISDKGAKEETYALTLLLYRKFEEHFGTTYCKELLQQDIGTPEGQKTAFEQRLRETNCLQYVAYATQLALELLSGEAPLPEQIAQGLDG